VSPAAGSSRLRSTWQSSISTGTRRLILTSYQALRDFAAGLPAAVDARSGNARLAVDELA